MVAAFERYAVYWVPGYGSELGHFGVRWTGWCADAGEHRPCPLIREISEDLRPFLDEVRLHGFHGKLHPAFQLAEGRSEWALDGLVEAIAESSPVTTVPRLHLALIGERLALAPAEGDAELDRLILRLARDMAGIRGPASSDRTDNARRRVPSTLPRFADEPAALSTPVGAIPILEPDCFHVPLTGPLPRSIAGRFAAEVAPLVLPLLESPQEVNELCIVGDPGHRRPFRVLRRLPLGQPDMFDTGSVMETLGPQVLSPLKLGLH